MKPLFVEAPASIFFAPFVQALVLFFLFLALLYNVTELILWALCLLALGGSAWLWSRVSLKRLECRLDLNRTRLFPGMDLCMHIQAVNAKWLPILFGFDLLIPGDVAGADTSQRVSDVRGLLWHQRLTLRSVFFPRRRGVFDLGPPQIRTADLFGFFPRFRRIRKRFEVVVYPRIIPVRPLSVPKRTFFGIPGARSPVEDPVFIFGTRDYQTGRPARRIHWKASARHDRLQEKICEPAQQEKVLLLLDVEGFDHPDLESDFEKCLEVIASLVLQLDRRRLAMGFVFNGRTTGACPHIISVTRNARQMTTILESLARMTPAADGGMLDILSRGYTLPGGISSVYFTARWSRRTCAAAAFLRQRSTPVQFVLAGRPAAEETRGTPASADAAAVCYLTDLAPPEETGHEGR